MPYDPKHRDHEMALRSLIRRGTIDFDAIVAELKVNGFIDDTHKAMTMGRPGFNRFDSEEFEALFRFFYPDQVNEMDVLPYGVSMSVTGDFVYALYDCKRISREELTQLVRRKYSSG
jgi:hypothetical protein